MTYNIRTYVPAGQQLDAESSREAPTNSRHELQRQAQQQWHLLHPISDRNNNPPVYFRHIGHASEHRDRPHLDGLSNAITIEHIEYAEDPAEDPGTDGTLDDHIALGAPASGPCSEMNSSDIVESTSDQARLDVSSGPIDELKYIDESGSSGSQHRLRALLGLPRSQWRTAYNAAPIYRIRVEEANVGARRFGKAPCC